MGWEDYGVVMCADYQGEPCKGRCLVVPTYAAHMAGLSLGQAVQANLAMPCCLCEAQEWLYRGGRGDALAELSYAGQWPEGALHPKDNCEMPPAILTGMKQAAMAERHRIGRPLTDLEAMRFAGHEGRNRAAGLHGPYLWTLFPGVIEAPWIDRTLPR